MDVEALVRVVDKVNPNSQELSDSLFKRGDVLTVQVAGWPWTERERTNPAWRIIRINGITRAQADNLVSQDTPRFEGERIIRRRSVKIDLDGVEIQQAERDKLADNGRAEPVITVPTADLIAAAKPKPARP